MNIWADLHILPQCCPQTQSPGLMLQRGEWSSVWNRTGVGGEGSPSRPAEGCLEEGPVSCVQELPKGTGENPRRGLRPAPPFWPRRHPSPTKASSPLTLLLDLPLLGGLCVRARHALPTWQELLCSASTATHSSTLVSRSGFQAHIPSVNLGLPPGFGQQAGGAAQGRAGHPGPTHPPMVLRGCCPHSRQRPGPWPPQAPHTVACRATLHGPQQPGLTNAAISNTIPCILEAGLCSQPRATCPCAVSSSLSRGGPSPGRSCAPLPWLQGQTVGASTPTPARLGF